MGWRKQIERAAQVSDDDLRATIYVRPGVPDPIEGEPVPPQMRCRCDFGDDAGDVAIADVLSPKERTDFRASLLKLRDAGLVAAGFEEDDA